MRTLTVAVLAVAVLTGCATLVTPADSDSSMIIGELTIDMSGVGTAPNGADGVINTRVPYAAALILHSEASGKRYELRTDIPSGFFSLANAEPGTYRVTELWAQVKTSNDYVTLISSVDKSPTFEVMPGRIANLGVISWRFTFDLTWAKSTNSISFTGDYQPVAQELARADPQSVWSGRSADQIAMSGEITATPQAVALPPRGSFEQIIIP